MTDNTEKKHFFSIKVFSDLFIGLIFVLLYLSLSIFLPLYLFDHFPWYWLKVVFSITAPILIMMIFMTAFSAVSILSELADRTGINLIIGVSAILIWIFILTAGQFHLKDWLHVTAGKPGLDIDLGMTIDLNEYSFFKFQNGKFLKTKYTYSTKTLYYTSGDLKGQPYLRIYYWIVPLVKHSWQDKDPVRIWLHYETSTLPGEKTIPYPFFLSRAESRQSDLSYMEGMKISDRTKFTDMVKKAAEKYKMNLSDEYIVYKVTLPYKEYKRKMNIFAGLELGGIYLLFIIITILSLKYKIKSDKENKI